MKTFFLTLILSFSAFGIEATYMQKKVAEALIKTNTIDKYRSNSERYALQELKHKTSINKNGAITLAALGYTAATGRVDTAKFIKARVKIRGAVIYPSIVYDLKETSGQVTFMITIPF